ncbi:hypothetical protein [Cryptosporangium aurantiacum]|uniref:Uncharacterized protein n=1 Tax=Cryptosporangium aurantiacum TaxID=134849 RepID=A0A1M7QNJ3_9ACTN|nr:hypothetical protein [Cryptosporangium aurantiacum]SHN32708.1 hypothetical protein SAMN05443668_10569 [Cryptosporangium aurantiacum]
MKRVFVTIGVLALVVVARRGRHATLIALLGGYYLRRTWSRSHPPLWARAGSRMVLGPGAIDGYRRRRSLL